MTRPHSRRPTRTWTVLATALTAGLALTAFVACGDHARAQAQTAKTSTAYPVKKSDAEWRKTLSAEQFNILRQAGTERAFTGKYWDHKGEGVYVCAGCGQPLYASKDKFKSGTGWPSYTQAVKAKAILVHKDTAFGMVREELVCSNCGGHLGHVFNDGPAPTGKRHCINSASLLFKPAASSPPPAKAPPK